MILFSEIYNCYFQIIKSILERKPSLSEEELRLQITDFGYEESVLFLMPKILSGEWDLFKKEDHVFASKLSSSFYVPLTTLQKSFLKSILGDEKIQLFLDAEQQQKLDQVFSDVSPLWINEDFYYYDRFEDKDDFTNPEYINHFRSIVTAIKNKQQIDVLYQSRTGNRVHHWYIPCRLEYSVKNDKFRLIAIENRHGRRPKIEIINLDRMQEVHLLDIHTKKTPNINDYIKRSYYKDPVQIIIKNERNALERAMLQFANYEKNTTKIDEDTYECLIYYNKNVETELLIEVLSFGPMIKVVGNEVFLKQVKERLRKHQTIYQGIQSDRVPHYTSNLPSK